MVVPTKYFRVVLTSDTVPHEVLHACCCAVGVVLGNYYHSSVMPVGKRVELDEGINAWEVSHAVIDWQQVQNSLSQHD